MSIANYKVYGTGLDVTLNNIAYDTNRDFSLIATSSPTTCQTVTLSSTGQYGLAGKYGGKKAKELGVGIHAFTAEQKSEVGKKSGYKTKELGIGIHGLSKEERIENSKNAGKLGGKVAGNQKWMCEETGFISNAGGLSKYQKARGIDTSKRVRIS